MCCESQNHHVVQTMNLLYCPVFPLASCSFCQRIACNILSHNQHCLAHFENTLKYFFLLNHIFNGYCCNLAFFFSIKTDPLQRILEMLSSFQLKTMVFIVVLPATTCTQLNIFPSFHP